MQVSTGIKAVLALILFQILSACAPPPPLRYSGQITAKPRGDFEQATTRVSAAVEDWRNSSIEAHRRNPGVRVTECGNLQANKVLFIEGTAPFSGESG
jgi:hypothetical protein